MRRREFIAGLGVAATSSVVARAQPAKLPIIGFLGPLTPDTQSDWTAAFVEAFGITVGSKAARLRSSIAGEKDAASGSPKSRRSWSV
jgi:spermidine/putrescine-binding protein